jgi:hypothetical protein
VTLAHVRPARAFLVQIVLVAALFAVYQRALHSYLRATGGRLGTIGADLVVPLHAQVDVRVSLWLLPPLLVLGAWLLLARKLFLTQVGPRVLLASGAAFFPAIGLSVAMIDAHPLKGKQREPIIEPYARTEWEYYGDVPAVERVGGPAAFLERYARPRFFATLSLHSQTHPPGGVLFLWAVAKLFGPGRWAAALATIAFTALVLLPVYALARELYGDAVARCALAFFLVAPNFVMFTTTSMDGPFSVLPITSVYLFHRALAARRPRAAAAAAILTGLALAGAAFMTYAAVFVPLYLVAFAALALLARRELVPALARTLLLALLAFLGAHVAVALATGYEPTAAVRAAMAHDREMVGTGYESLGHYLNLSFANLLAFLFCAGVPLTTAWGREVAAAWRRRLAATGDVVTAAFALSLALVAFSTLFTLETERIWIFMVPWIAIAAAKNAVELMTRDGSARVFCVTVSLTCVQLVAMEAILRTAW